MDARLDITDHAVQRYIERHARGAEYGRARQDLEKLFSTATQMKSKTHAGQHLWRVVEPPMLFVVKPDDGKHVLVTVLPSGAFTDEVEDIGDHDEVVAAYERIQHLLRDTKTTSQKVQIEPEVAAFKVQVQGALKALMGEFTHARNNCRALRTDLEKLSTAVSDVQIPAASAGEPADRDLRRRLQKQIAHAKRMEENGNQKGRALVVAIQALMKIDNTDAAAALQKIGESEPGFLSEKFWNR